MISEVFKPKQYFSEVEAKEIKRKNEKNRTKTQKEKQKIKRRLSDIIDNLTLRNEFDYLNIE